MAWVEQRGECWRVRYRTDSGTSGSVSGFGSQRAAEDYAADLATDQRRGMWIDPSGARMRVADWVDRWVETIDVEPRTEENYRRCLRVQIVPHWGRTPSAQARPSPRLSTVGSRAHLGDARAHRADRRTRRGDRRGDHRHRRSPFNPCRGRSRLRTDRARPGATGPTSTQPRWTPSRRASCGSNEVVSHPLSWTTSTVPFGSTSIWASTESATDTALTPTRH